MRKLQSLIRGLPPKGMVARAVLGPAATWGDREELLASAVDWLGHIDYLLHRAHFKGGGDPPKPVPRPGQDDEPVVSGRPTGAEIRAMVFGPDNGDGPAQ